MPCQTPIAITTEGECHTDTPRDNQSGNTDNRFLTVHQMFRQISAMCNPNRSNDEGKEDKASQLRECRLVEIRGYQWRTEEKNHIERDTYQNIEPKHRIEIFFARFFLIDKRHGKTAVLDIARHCRENGKQSHNAIVVRGKQPPKDDAKENVQELQTTTTDGSPKQTFRGFVFQRFTHLYIIYVFYSIICKGNAFHRDDKKE